MNIAKLNAFLFDFALKMVNSKKKKKTNEWNDRGGAKFHRKNAKM